jgi:hypothetical protein
MTGYILPSIFKKTAGIPSYEQMPELVWGLRVKIFLAVPTSYEDRIEYHE